MSTSLTDAYWNCLLSDAAYSDGSVDSLNQEMLTNSLVVTVTDKYFIKDVSATSASGFAAMVVQDKTTSEFTIAFRGTEKSMPDWASDAVGVTTGVAGDQVVDMYNYLLRVFAPVGAVVDQYVYDVGAGALRVADTASGLGLVTTGTTVDFTGHSLGGHLAMDVNGFAEATGWVGPDNSLNLSRLHFS